MSGYRYRCNKCGITWDEVTTKHKAEAERTRHRHEAHDDGPPDGDTIHTPNTRPWPPTGALIAALVIVTLFIWGSRHGQ
ncbi:hypothetical protein M1P56_16420 [Streptomyces sp. HU2014]|uniref:Uncharacterized protein n=1 Tax=Streptomyces albireticuli TaxID=1940 RepID=A0A1Z2LDV3_9ACTN|nr:MULTISPECIES: hypothetical protein [Streptomyces]ARZ72479.1 hypothetical protein SMD11_6903 [Streptomyces albireticuli]UQI45828.1 hypothetical protein M1P56_16420 [Streptomyces sp. HU2014]